MLFSTLSNLLTLLVTTLFTPAEISAQDDIGFRETCGYREFHSKDGKVLWCCEINETLPGRGPRARRNTIDLNNYIWNHGGGLEWGLGGHFIDSCRSCWIGTYWGKLTCTCGTGNGQEFTTELDLTPMDHRLKNDGDGHLVSTESKDLDAEPGVLLC